MVSAVAVALALGSVACGSSTKGAGTAAGGSDAQSGGGHAGSGPGDSSVGGAGGAGPGDGPPDVAPDGGPDAASDAPRPPADLTGICTESGWCWQRPRPQGNDLSGIWVAAEDDVWVVGYGGTIIHWDGRAWASRAIAGVHDNLYTVWGTGSEVWVGGAGVAHHWKAGGWTQDLGPTSGAQRIFGTGPANVWMVTDVPGFANHYNGQIWAQVALPAAGSTCRSVWASGAQDVWLACDQLLHYDGAGFTSFNVAGGELSGSGPSDVWALGAQAGSVAHWNGQAWITTATAVAGSLRAIWARSAMEVWAVGDYGALERYDGVRWTQVSATGPFAHTFVMGVRASTLWTGGGQGFLALGDGNTLSPMTEVTAAIASVRSVWAFGASDAWAATDDGLLRKDGASWVSVPATAGQRYDDVWGSGPGDVWLMKRGGALKHWNGATLTDAQGPAMLADSVAITGSAADNVWLVNPRAFYHWDGAQWTTVPNTASVDAPITDAWTSGPRDLWAIDGGGSVWHWDGTGFTTTRQANTALRAIWGTAPDDVWAAGDGHVLVHWDGQTWRFLGPPRPAGVSAVDFYALSGTSKTNLWALGAGGYTFRWNGSAWSAFPAYTFGNYTSIAATADGGAFYAGWGFGILHHDP